jgi:hypothetical protein
MYCPRCGDSLEDTDGTLACVRGEMPLSKDLGRRLRECFEEKSREPIDERVLVGGQWFCPGCGVATKEEVPGAVRCVRCGRSLGEFMFALVELHPHKRVDAQTTGC